MFGWLKSIFGSETEQENIVPPPLPSKVKKAKKLVAKKIAKKTDDKKVTSVKDSSKVTAKKAKISPKEEKIIETPKAEVKLEVKETTDSTENTPKKRGRTKKTSS